jgi:hypothetical protein
MRFLALALLLTSSAPAFAGFFELGASANYRSSSYDKNNFIQSLTYTASMSYYFSEMCAFELGYTTGYSKQVTQGSTALDHKETVEDNIDLASLDLVLSFADRQDPFRPYVKLGGGYLSKARYRQIDDGDKTLLTEPQKGWVPSGGFGLSINFTKELSIKLGVEAWTSPPSDKKNPLVVDVAGRAGISWLF